MSTGRERGDQQQVVSGNGQTAPASGNGQAAAPKAPERPKYGPPSGGGRMWGQTRPVEKSLNFLPSFKRLLGHLAPERMILSLVVLLAVIGIVMNVLGPKILGMATDVIFTGILGKNLPSGATKEQVVAELRAQGDNTFADMVERLNIVPGQGIDFTLLGELLLVALGLYLLASLFLWLQGYLLNGAVQRSIYTMRSQVEGKINRLPLSYFDKQTRGELL
ncbi:MAG TPA: ABC transporter transmembrane domain-containing protein, partial [Propionibacteriaceae bacterium]|nr:ABC transporter transmembrane domain-containing protein [Propionibacteriaceae bacterium]